jgi:hypothetical protein
LAVARPGLPLVVVLLLGTPLLPAATQSAASGLREYPSFDRDVAAFVERGLTAKAAAAALVSAPSAPTTIELLLRENRIDDALACLPAALAGEPADIAAVLRTVSEGMHVMERDDPRGLSRTFGAREGHFALV